LGANRIRSLSDRGKALKTLDDEQLSLLQQAKRGFPEQMVEADNKRINGNRTLLMQRKAELEHNIADAVQAASNMDNIEKFCELASRDISKFTEEDKKLAMQMLDAKVFIYPDRINIEGIIPIFKDIPSNYLTSR
jgi:DNA repair exonuclease SbcCD ATPase subunit